MPRGVSPTAVLSSAPPDSDRPLSLVNSGVMSLMAFITNTGLYYNASGTSGSRSQTLFEGSRPA